MGPRKTLKKNAGQALRRRFLLNMLLVFAVGLLMGSFSLSSGLGQMRTGLMDNLSNAEIVGDLLRGIGAGRPSAEPGPAVQYTAGVLAVFVNQITATGSVLFGILNGLNQLLFRGRVMQSVVIMAGSLAMLGYLIYGRNILLIGECRYFLEHRRYRETHADRLLFVYRTGKTRNAARVMFLRSLFSLLWWLTIIGGVVKHYEYRMIPYILADNPGIPWRDAFRLSKKLMLGDKWNVCKLDLSLLGWYLLSWISFSLASMFYLSPYVECINAELYMTLRAAKTDAADRALLWDELLAVETLQPGAYPEAQYPLHRPHRHIWPHIDYRKNYSLVTYVLFFITFSSVGWIWETVHHLLSYGELVNRGTMAGPWLPIYGVGGVLILLLLRPLRDRPGWTFLGAFLLCGLLEYGTSWLLEQLLGVRYWDYTGYFMNLNGRICLEGLLVFGLAGLAFTYVFAPLLDQLYQRIPERPRRLVALLLALAFLSDLGYSAFHPNSGEGVTTPVPTVAVRAEQTL